MAGDDDEMLMTRLLRRQQNSIFARSDKSVAYVAVTNDRRLCSTFCTNEANCTNRRAASATAELLVYQALQRRNKLTLRH